MLKEQHKAKALTAIVALAPIGAYTKTLFCLFLDKSFKQGVLCKTL